MTDFIIGSSYKRSEIHNVWGNQRQGGISTPNDHPVIFLFSAARGSEFGYEDGWHENGFFHYSGGAKKEICERSGRRMPMYSNIGGRIKGLASIIAWGGIALSFLVALFLIIPTWSSVYEGSSYAKILGFSIFIVGSTISWVSSWLLYGYGEMIERISEISTFLRNHVTRNSSSSIT